MLASIGEITAPCGGKRAVKYRVAGFLAVLAGTVWLEGGEHVGLPDLDDSASGS